MKVTIQVPNLAKDLEREHERLNRLFKDEFAREGEEIVSLVRNRKAEESWYDRTGNLRSSVGYLLTKDGKKQGGSAFEAVGASAEGSVKGLQYAHQLAKQRNTGWSLIIVAGMEYAEFVERIEGKDVLSSARLRVEDDITDIAQSIQKRFDKGFNR